MICYKVEDFIQNWIYPAYYLRNLLFHRHDLIKIPTIKPYEYSDTTYIMFHANMQMIVDFIEKEQPEKHILWYKDEEGEDVGHKYGEYKDKFPMLYPELEGQWIMDIIKDIYKWYKETYPQLQKEHEILLSHYVDNTIGEFDFEDDEEDENGLSKVRFDKSNCPKTIEELRKKGFNEEIVSKYLPDNKDWLDSDKCGKVTHELEYEIIRQEQKYLHLCIEVRQYLWT